MSEPLVDPVRSRALLVGCAEYAATAKLADLPSVMTGVRELRRLLLDSERGTMRPKSCETITNPQVPNEVDLALSRGAQEAHDALLVYYSGHGIPSRDDGSLYLAVGRTEPERLHATALPIDWIRKHLRESNARSKVVILDCCFSGRAISTMSAENLADEVDVAGSFVMTSASANVRALAPDGEPFTAFTGALISVLRDGVPDAGPYLTLDVIFRTAKRALRDMGRPEPQSQRVNEASSLALAKNPAYEPHNEPSADRSPMDRGAPPRPTGRPPHRRAPGRQHRHVDTSAVLTASLLVDVPHDAEVVSVALAVNDDLAASGSADKTARIWSPRDGRPVLSVTPGMGAVKGLAFSPDGRRLATTAGQAYPAVRIWDVAHGREIVSLRHKGLKTFLLGYVHAVAFSPDGGRLATGGGDRTARVWTIADDSVREILRLDHKSGAVDEVRAVAFGPDGLSLATGTGRGSAIIWRLTDGRELLRLAHDGPVNAVAFSPDGRSLATAGQNGFARILRLADGVELLSLRHQAAVKAVALSTNGEWLATASNDGTARVWRVTDGRELVRVAHHRAVSAVALSGNGRRMLTGCADKFARVWALSP
jgi:WD40 repeat protein